MHDGYETDIFVNEGEPGILAGIGHREFHFTMEVKWIKHVLGGDQVHFVLMTRAIRIVGSWQHITVNMNPVKDLPSIFLYSGIIFTLHNRA